MAHYYEQTPDNTIEPRHFVPLAKRPDELRPTRITDVKKWVNEGRVVVPSVTTILDVLAKPALVNWKVDQHLKTAFTVLDFDGDCAAYCEEIKRLTELEMEKAPTIGTDIHKSLELFAAGDLAEDHQDYDLCGKAFTIIEEYTDIPMDDWVSEAKFVSDLGFGGQVDISPHWIIDFKTKQDPTKWKPGKMVYMEHTMQLAAYRHGLLVPKAKCANVFICPATGDIDFHIHSETELVRGWNIFQYALGIWKEQNQI